jgi:hypothetical protein
VKALGIKKLETVLYKMSTNVELQIVSELSSLKAIDFYGTIPTEKSTGNAPKNISTQSACHIITDEVCTNLEQSNAKEAMDIKSNENSPKQLTPVTIMVVDTISSVKSRILLKVLLYSGSTTTMINRKCLPRNCQTCCQCRFSASLQSVLLTVLQSDDQHFNIHVFNNCKAVW